MQHWTTCLSLTKRRGDVDDDIALESPLSESTITKGMVDGSDLPPAVLFAAIANEDYLVGMKELKRWSELQEMLEDESLLPLELQSIYNDLPKAQGGDLLDEAGFVALYEAIDSLFEEVDDDEENEEGAAISRTTIVKRSQRTATGSLGRN